MACALTGSQALDCKDSVGGIQEIKVKVHTGSVFTGAVTYSSGTISAIAAGSQSGWYTYGLESETASANNNGQYNVQKIGRAHV